MSLWATLPFVRTILTQLTQRFFRISGIALCFGLTALSASAPTWANTLGGVSLYAPAQLKSLTASFLADYYAGENKIEISVGNLDPRVGQRSCQTPLVFDPRDPNGQGGNIHIQINCNDTISWSLYIPAQISIYKEVPVAAQDLMRGQVISPDDIHYQEVNLSNYRYKIIKDINELAGKELKRNIGKNTVFIPTAIDEPTLVRRNDVVQIVTDIGGIRVNVEGVALGDGRLSQSIRVRNNQSKRIVSGIVIASGVVKVN